MNSWDERKNFVKHPGKYDLLLIDHNPKVIKDRYLDYNVVISNSSRVTR